MRDWNVEIAQLESILSRINCAGGGGGEEQDCYDLLVIT
jgi:hypothetical protein